MHKAYILIFLFCLGFSYAQVEEADDAAAPAAREQKAKGAHKDYIIPAPIQGNRIVSESAWMDYYQKEGYNNPDILKMVDDYIPDTYTALYIHGRQAGNTTKAISFLEKAIAVNPAGRAAYESLAEQYELQGRGKQKRNLLQKWAASGAAYSSQQSTLAFNQLASVQGKSVIITCTAASASAIQIQQEIKGAGGQVTILSEADLLGNTDLARLRLKNAGIGTPAGQPVASFLAQLEQQHADVNVYLAMDCNPNRYGALNSNLYLTGVAYQYSSSRLENLDMLIHNWEHRFIKPNIGRGRPALEELLYFYPLVTLSRAYKDRGETDQATKTRSMAEYLARTLNRTDLLNYLP